MRRILVKPVLLGKRRSLLKEGAARVNLDLIDAMVTAPRLAILTYQSAR
jgi:hypothetical protein